MDIQLKNVRIYLGLSRETTAFTADIFVDGKKAGYAKNDGGGGPTDYDYYPSGRELFEKAEKYCLTLPEFTYPEYDLTVQMNLEHMIDNLLDAHLLEKANKKALNAFNKKMLDCILIGEPGNYYEYSYIYLKIPIAHIIINPKLRGNFVEILEKQTKELLPGKQILNTNIPADLLPICKVN